MERKRGIWDGNNLLRQITEKALPIAEALYPGYEFLWLFDNATSHSVYADDALRVTDMNKGPGGQGNSIMRSGWYYEGDERITQEMTFIQSNPSTGTSQRIAKGIQRVLEERKLWPCGGGLLLKCPPPRCNDCLALKDCKACIKGTRCPTC